MTTQYEVIRQDIRPKGAWYGVYVDRVQGAKPAVVDIAKLAETLPHGSGIDSDWHIEVKRSGDVIVLGDFHQMTDGGYYDGWKGFKFTLARCTKNEYKALSGPCEGQFQVTRKIGTVYLKSFTGGGHNADYLYDVVSCALSDEMGIRAITSDLVSSEEAARALR